MLLLRSSRRAVRLAEALPTPFRSLSTVSRDASHSINRSVLQHVSIDFNSRRNVGFHGSFTVRHFSATQSDAKAKEEEAQQHSTDVADDPVYQAPMSRAVRLMKAVSVTSCTLTSIGMPVLCVLSEQDTSAWAMCGTIMLFGLGTTSLFHYLFKPYVMRMWLTPATEEEKDDQTVTVETVTLFAQLEKTSFQLSDVSPPTQAMHPMVSFQARDRHYFIHPEAFDDQNLLNKLVGAGKRM
ncbi:hypothetical protein PHMEG_000218 [Phytophthora megakarya]|uniref:Transmembrane protein n=1 Tax=Phytophthora megakarya TaxID=4795 RepID=A0A225X3M9_9STRA|nr:hypothetical protein PHMEG_000218 [Phytophthora megakarya]